MVNAQTTAPWSRSKPLAWDIVFHLPSSVKFSQLSSTRILFPVAIDTAGTWYCQTVFQHCPWHYTREMQSFTNTTQLARRCVP